tara:strand:- start:1224 stop:1637 length:414 start_codon:yes stop_codon:yes gene_type:complete
MNDIIHHDISNLLYSISINYNIDLEVLRDRYLPIISVEKKKFKFKRKVTPRSNTITSSITQPHTRCCARVWAGGAVSYDETNKEWIYGAQCTKVKYASKPYCPLHLRLIEKHGELVHGDFFKPPPHPHFEKFKQKKI